MLRILSECSASIRTSLQGLDYFVAEGAEAFDNLITIAHNIAELGGGIEWESRVVECLKASKLYLKGDFKVIHTIIYDELFCVFPCYNVKGVVVGI